MIYQVLATVLLFVAIAFGFVYARYAHSKWKKQTNGYGDLVQESLEAMIKLLNPEVVRGWNIIIQYNISGAGYWYIEISDEKANLRKGRHSKPNLTMMTDCEIWIALVRGELSGEMAYLSGKMKSEGDIEVFLQHEEIFDRKKTNALEMAKGSV